MTADTHTPVQISPLTDWDPRLPDGLTARELPFLTQLTLRVTPGSAAASTIEGYLGYALPGACRAQLDTEVKALCLGPDEWLLIAPAGSAADLTAGLRSAIGEATGEEIGEAIGDGFATVTDTSAQRTVLALSGPLLPEVLSQGCALDLAPGKADAGTCHTTLLAQAGVTLVVHEAGPRAVWLLVRSSFAGYLAAWLVDACTEYTGAT
ncbi:sarcosine oxidase subunit gamma [Streptomyces sp. NPDC002754]